MKKFKLLIVTLVFLTNLNLHSQNVTVSGYVKNSKSYENLINATIRIDESNQSVFTNEFGFYSFKIKSNDTIKIIASYLGYQTVIKSVIANKNKTIDFLLIENNNIDSIIISNIKTVNQTKEIGTHTLQLEQIRMIPSLGEENDIIKAIQLLPGVQSGNEGSNGMFVRGGGIDENLILLDDVPLYNVNHLGGFVSAFNPNAINYVKIIKGGFPAKYGGRLSSIIDVRMFKGNQNKITTNFSISPITSNFSINGPIKKQKTTFMLSARAFYLGSLMRFVTLFNDYSIGYNFYDLNFKLTHKIDKKNIISFSFYKGNDRTIIKLDEFFIDLNNTGDLKTNWGNSLFAIKWNKIINSNLFVNTTLAHTKYKYKNTVHFKSKLDSSTYYVNLNTSIKDLFLNSDFEYLISKNLKLNFGFASKFLLFQPAYTEYLYNSNDYQLDTTYKISPIFALDNSIYAETDFTILKIFSFRTGLRFNDYFVQNEHFTNIEPRIVFLIKTSKNSSIKSSYSQTQQNVHLISGSSTSMPMDIWATSDNIIHPSNSQQTTIGFYTSLFKKKIELSVETYYKTSTNLVTFKEGATYLSIVSDWTDKLETNGLGKSYGLEFFLEKKQGKTTGWISYTLSETKRKFENINFGNEYYFKYDRRHNLSIILVQNITKNLTFSSTWVYGSGYPYTLPVARYDIDNEIINDAWISSPSEQIVLFADYNQFRMKAYHRMDLAINWSKTKNQKTKTLSLSIYNVYNRKNPYSYYLKQVDDTWNIYQQSLFPIIPSISYSLKF